MTDDVVAWLRGVHERAEELARDSTCVDDDGRWWVDHAPDWENPAAREMFHGSGPRSPELLASRCRAGTCNCCRIEGDGITIYDEGGHGAAQAELICLNDPASVLARVEAERQILETCLFWLHEDDRGKDPCAASVIPALAAGWKHMPGYRAEWSL